MEYKIPGNNIPITLIADIAAFLLFKPNAIFPEILKYTGRSEPYVRSGITLGKMLGLVKDGNIADKSAEALGRTPNSELKLMVMRKCIQEFEPFVTFIQFCLNGDSSDESARKVYTMYGFSGRDPLFLKTVFISWGSDTGIFRPKDKGIEVNDEISRSLTKLERNEYGLDDDMATRLYISNRLGNEAFADMSSDEIEDLVKAIKNYNNDIRGAIDGVGRAFEDFLRRMAQVVVIDVSKKHGIGEVVNALYNNMVNGKLENKIHSKHWNIGKAIGDIRNMSGHGMEAVTMERWSLSAKSAFMFIELVLSTIQSIYTYIRKSNSLSF